MQVDIQACNFSLLRCSTGLPLLCLLIGALVIGQAWAIDPLSKDELSSHCRSYHNNPQGKDGVFCVRYIQGFIDGAVATDERVAQNVIAIFAEEETFAQRAIRTRLGNRMNLYDPSYYAEFCLGAPVPLAEVVGRVVDNLGDGEFATEQKSARDVIYLSLRTHYPCTPKDVGEPNS